MVRVTKALACVAALAFVAGSCEQQPTELLDTPSVSFSEGTGGTPNTAIPAEYEPDLEVTISSASSTGEHILIYGPSMISATYNEQTLAEAEGHTVTVVDATTWAGMTTAQFASYDAIVFGDPSCQYYWPYYPPPLDAAEANKAVWSAAITGPMYVQVSDPVFHSYLTQARQLIKSGINFAVSGSGTGLYASLSCYYAYASPNTPVNFLGALGTFQVRGQFTGGSYDMVTIVDPTHPAMAGLTSPGLSSWGNAIHGFLTTYPSSFNALATNPSEDVYIIATPAVIEVEIDIKPGSDPNSINCDNPDGVIAVAILTTDDFDATTVDHTTVTFEGASETHVDKKTGEARRHEEDVDYDGDIDLVFHFSNGETGLACSSTEGTLNGETLDGVPIEGTDAVRMIRHGDCSPPPSALVSWWPGDGNATDIAGGNDGTLEDGATFGAGMVGQAFSLDGDGDHVSVPDRSDWTFGDGPFTIDLWVNFDEVRWRSPFVDHNEGGGETNKWIFWYDELGHRDPSGPALRFHINSPTLGPLDPVVYPWTPSTGHWYHVAVTRTGSSYSLYIDGVLAITETDGNTIPDADVQLSIGQSEYQYYFDGLIDEVEIFNRALSTDEVREIYEAGSAGKCKG